MSAYWSDLLVVWGAFAVGCVFVYLHDRKPRNRYRRGRKEVLPPPSPECRRVWR